MVIRHLTETLAFQNASFNTVKCFTRPTYRTRGNIDVKKTLTNLTNQTIRQYFFPQILAS